MELQHINVKLLVRNPENVDFSSFVPIFHRWIQNQSLEGKLLDVADYRHVPGGPGVILIGHEGDYSVDNTDNRVGIRYNRKATLDGNNQDRLRQAMLAAVNVFLLLEEEPGSVHFNGQDFEVSINDRLLAPNSAETLAVSKPDINAFFEKLLGTKAYHLSFETDRRRLFTIFVKAPHQVSPMQLQKTLLSSTNAECSNVAPETIER